MISSQHQPQAIYKNSIALDLGAKYTGIFLTHHRSGDPLRASDTQACTLVMPSDGDGILYSSQSRRAARHRMRGHKRFALARKLLFTIVDHRFAKLGMSLTGAEVRTVHEALSALLKRRGYSRIDANVDLTVLDAVDPSIFEAHPILNGYFNGASPLGDQWENLCENLSELHRFYNDQNIPQAKKEHKKFISRALPELDKKDVADAAAALSALREDANNLILALECGHRHRSEYLRAIRADMAHDSRLAPVSLAFGGVDRLWRLVGNLSNLQLRAYRWYFNAPYMARDNIWDIERLQKNIVRAFQYFHPAPAQSDSHKQLIEELKAAKDIVECLCSLDPERTIPPYEDQNNRRPPVDLTLLLSPSSLTQQYGERWKVWAQRLASRDSDLLEDLDEIVSTVDRKSRSVIMGGHPFELNDYKLSYVLHRAMDRSKPRDPYSLRRLSQPQFAQANSAAAALELLGRVIGTQHISSFLDLCAKYYDEVQQAKVGLWRLRPHNVLERADIHPPMKNKVLNILVGSMLGIDGIRAQEFIEKIWPSTVIGRSSVRSLCQFIEKSRKDYGNGFALEYERACRQENEGLKLNAEQKELVSISKKVNGLTNFLQKSLGLDDRQADRIRNPFTLSQLYNLIETDRAGFASTSKAVFLENAWRMRQPKDGVDGANCARLPADCIRPFDGMLRRLLDRQSWEITRLASSKIRKSVIETNARIDVAIIVEQNKFDFSASLLDIKRNLVTKAKVDKGKKQAQQAADRMQQRWLNKTERIKAASLGICAYTGKPLADEVEIDHIIPRSRTTKQLGTIFNAEPNLIAVSREGNQIKADREYSLENLSPVYLERQFGTSDLATIENTIELTVKELEQNGRLKIFELLSEVERKCVRHALFLPSCSDARQTVQGMLGNLFKTRVNGTQAWLARSVIEKVESCLGDWCRERGNRLCFGVWSGQAEDVHALRTALGRADAELEKPEVQPVASHAVDAMCVYASACGVESIREFMDADGDLADESQIEKLRALYRANCDLIRVTRLNPAQKKDLASAPIFKEGIVAEKFLPVLVHKGQVFVGFEIPKKSDSNARSAAVTGKNPMRLVDVIKPYVKEQDSIAQKTSYTLHIDPAKAFELLAEVARSEQVAPEQRVAANVLDALRYCTVRKEIKAVFLSANKKLIGEKDWEKKKKDFCVSVKLSARTVGFPEKDSFKVESSVQIPAIDAWCQVWDAIKSNDAGTFDEKQLDVTMEDARRSTRRLQHVKVRRVWSLPTLAKPSGLFRIKRQTSEKELIYQVHTINGAAYVGFAADSKGDVDWKSPQIRSALNADDVVPIGARFQRVANLVPMTEWRRIYSEDCIELWMCPNSEGRCRIRARVPGDTFLALVQDQLKSPMRSTSEMKSADWGTVSLPLPVRELMGKPRSNLFIESVSKETVVFSYIVESTSAAMKMAYNRALEWHGYEKFND